MNFDNDNDVSAIKNDSTMTINTMKNKWKFRKIHNTRSLFFSS